MHVSKFADGHSGVRNLKLELQLQVDCWPLIDDVRYGLVSPRQIVVPSMASDKSEYHSII